MNTGPAVKDTVHRIARVNYLPRALGFGGTFVALVLLAMERDLGTVTLLFGVFTFLIYPHLVFLHARLARDSKGAEQFNLLLDSAVLGVWSAVVAYNLWITFALLLATLLNNAINGGPRRLFLAGGCFIAGSLAWSLIWGFEFQPEASLGLTMYMATASLLYILGVGVTYYHQNTQLARAHRAIARNNAIFHSLVELGLLSNEAKDMEQLTDKSLDYFRELNPQLPFGLVLFDRSRPRRLLHGGFRGVDEDSQDRILAHLARHNTGKERSRSLALDDSGHQLLAIPMYRQLELAAGYLIMDRQRAERLADVMDLFVDQLATALQNQLLNEELRKAAETDGLTGLFNRAYLEDELAAAISRKQSHPSADFSVIMLDVIGLKRANDNLGHEAGDQLIRTIGKRLRRHARKSDVVARFGGDEFVVLCHDCREEDARRAVERLMTACQSGNGHVRLRDGQHSEIPIEISVGVAGSDCYPADKVMATADARMYEDKEAFYRRYRRQR